jgi:aarF domain-containing kinase
MRRARLVPREVALLLLEAFSDMVFVHGRVHADPHPGNLLVRPLAEAKQGAPPC